MRLVIPLGKAFNIGHSQPNTGVGQDAVRQEQIEQTRTALGVPPRDKKKKKPKEGMNLRAEVQR